jgi:phosphate starvation-inducible PhoH-like protein
MSRNNKIKREVKKFQECDMKPQSVIDHEVNKNKLVHLNESQRQYISCLSHDDFVIGAGSAGTGKTYIAARIAAEIYSNNKTINNIILTRPNVEVGQKMGYLPGELQEKYAPYLLPFEKGLKDQLGGNKYSNDLYKRIIPKPVAYMRGETFDDSVILVDEAQNLSIVEMQMILTRIGINSRIFITGDEFQSDIRGKNGLVWLMEQIDRQNLPYEIVEFTSDDCVRSPLCKQMLHLIENEIS